MSLKTFVKVSKVSSLSDARYCAGMMVDMLGFYLEPNTEDYVAPEEFKEITDWVAGVAFVGEFDRSDIDSIKLAAQNYDLQYIEVTNIDYLESLSSLGIPLIYKCVVSSEQEVAKIQTKISYASDLVEFSIMEISDPSFASLVTDQLQSTSFPVVKGFNVDEKNIKDLESFWKGVQLVGTPEEQPGFKDYGEVMDVLEVLEEED